MRGHEGATARIVYDPGCGNCARSAAAVKEQLAPIGIDVQLVESNNPFGDMMAHPKDYEMRIGGSGPDWPDVASYLTLLFTQYLPQSWLPADVRSAVGIMAKQNDEAARERKAVALLAGPVAHDVPLTGIGYGVGGFFFSPRVGCRVFPPFGNGVALAELCLAKDAPTPGST